MNINADQYSDVVYYFSTPTSLEYFSLVEAWNQTLSINITCSIDDTILLDHVIEDYDNYSTPT